MFKMEKHGLTVYVYNYSLFIDGMQIKFNSFKDSKMEQLLAKIMHKFSKLAKIGQRKGLTYCVVPADHWKKV